MAKIDNNNKFRNINNAVIKKNTFSCNQISQKKKQTIKLNAIMIKRNTKAIK